MRRGGEGGPSSLTSSTLGRGLAILGEVAAAVGLGGVSVGELLVDEDA